MKILLAVFLFFTANVFALSPEKRLDDEKLEQRAVALFRQVRCLVCQGQVIESSDTEFSASMRELIRKKISAGKKDEEIKTQLLAEFGEDILLKSGEENEKSLFILPLLSALLGAFFLFRFFRKKSN
jgi:cytochrome c-type biogenesis protein CcmH